MDCVKTYNATLNVNLNILKSIENIVSPDERNLNFIHPNPRAYFKSPIVSPKTLFIEIKQVLQLLLSHLNCCAQIYIHNTLTSVSKIWTI